MDPERLIGMNASGATGRPRLLPALMMAAGLAAAGARGAQRPNIVVILSDDMGYSDIGCYGGEIETPNLDRLAANGLRFTQFYNTGRCCPTRASLLTGLYPHQAGVGHMMEDRGVDGYRGDLNRQCVTIAEVLKPAGYATYAVGKWHVTKQNRPKTEADKYNWPLQRGFDRYYGILNGAASYWDPNSLARDNQLITPGTDPAYQPDEPYHLTDAFSDNAAAFIREHPAGRPFFLYVAYTAAHWPLHARERDIARYRGHYDAGYPAIREARLARMKELGVVDPGAALSATAGDWEAVEDKRWEAACMEVYAAMIDQMDQGIGRILQALQDTGQFENTLILFLQDNGGCAEPYGRDPQGPLVIRGASPSLPPIPEDRIHYWDSTPKQTRDGWPTLRGHVMPGPADTAIGYGRAWANVSNTPHREYKHWVHEGGISTPLVVHWPAGIPARNELRHQPGHLVDVMATCVDLAGAAYPAEYRGQRIHPVAGTSLVPVFTRQPLGREILFWEHEGNRAIRLGDWKLVAKGRQGQWELYDISRDRSELHDLADEHPELVRLLSPMWMRKARATNVLPDPSAR